MESLAETHSNGNAALGADVSRRLKAMIQDRQRGEWALRLFRDAVRLGVQFLRNAFNGPEEERLSWDNPFIDVRHGVNWDFDTPWDKRGANPRLYRFTSEDLDIVDGVVSDACLEELADEHLTHELFHRLSGGRVHRRTTKDGPWSQFVISPENGRSMGEQPAPPPVLPPLSFSTTTASGVALKVSLVQWISPLHIDEAAREAYYVHSFGIQFWNGTHEDLSPAEMDALWEALLNPIPDETSTLKPTSTDLAPHSATAGTGQAPERAVTFKDARVLQDSRVRIDALALKAVGFFGDAKLWRNWASVKTWTELVENEVASIREAHGEAAFKDAPGIRGPLLRRTWNSAGVEMVELTKEAEEDLLETAGRKGFRRVQRDPDHREREYLVKRVSAGRGSLTLSLTWYDEAFTLSHEARDEKEKRLREEKARDAVALFPASEDERRKRDRDLALLGSMKDAARIAPRLLTAFYQQRANPIHLPAWELYLALGCEKNPHRFSRVNAALETLRRLDYQYKADGLGPELSGLVRGSFVTEIGQGEGRGAGAHRDVDFYITLSTWAIGCLQVFKQAEGRLKDPHHVFYDWNAKLEKEEEKVFKRGYVQGFSALASYYDTAAGLTPAQSRLRFWIEDQLTLRRDGTSKTRKSHKVHPSAADATEPRVYTSDFCPLLEPSRRYHAALGHFPQKHNAETGRTLQGRSQGPTTTGGPRAGGLLEALGYELPPGRAVQAREGVTAAALKDLRAVVEEYLGGRVVGKRKGVWLSLHEAERVRAEELLKEVAWFLFLPEDWRTRREKTFEEHHRRRYERGETDRPVRVITSTAKDATSAAKVGLDATELRVRLHAKRREREMNAEAVGKVFGVSKMTVSNWERGRDAGGGPIPEDLQPLILRWIEKGEGPTEDELTALAARRRGGKKRASR